MKHPKDYDNRLSQDDEQPESINPKQAFNNVIQSISHFGLILGRMHVTNPRKTKRGKRKH